MATYATTAPAFDLTTGTTFNTWSVPLSYALGFFGWKQQNDTGQGQWAVVTMRITNIVASGGTNTYTFDTLVGGSTTTFAPGMMIVIQNCTTAGNNFVNGVKLVTVSIAGTTGTFTCLAASGATEAGAAASTAQVGVTMQITWAVSASGTATYEYATPNLATTAGALILHNGMNVTITGCTTAGLNITGNIANVGGTPTHGNGAVGSFTIANGATVTGEDEHSNTPLAFGTAINSSKPGSGTYYYEIWKTNDAVGGQDWYVKVEYGASGSNGAYRFTMGTNTNGAGTLINPSTTTSTQQSSASATFGNWTISGDAGRLCMLAAHGNNWTGTTNPPCVVILERSYDNTGAATGTYFNLVVVQQNGTGLWQALYASGATTTQESGLPVLLPKTATTGNLGSTTLVSPVFPLVGGPGNPLTGIMIYRGSSTSVGDYGENQLVYVTIYGVQHPYITWNALTTVTSALAVNAGIMVRYD